MAATSFDGQKTPRFAHDIWSHAKQTIRRKCRVHRVLVAIFPRNFLAWGARGRGFKSRQPDYRNPLQLQRVTSFHGVRSSSWPLATTVAATSLLTFPRVSRRSNLGTMPHLTPRTLTYDGRTQTIPAWSRELGIPESTIRSRIDKLGQTVEQALGTPSDERFRPTGGADVEQLPPTAPRLRRDKGGRAYSRWTDPVTKRRKVKVFGPWGDAETVRAYRVWAAEWLAGSGEPTVADGEQVSVARLVMRYVEWANSHYQKNGRRTSEPLGIRAAMRVVNDLYGDTAAAEFAPTRLLAVQAEWVKSGIAMTTANGYLSKVVRCWSWGVSRGLVPAAVADALTHVARLQVGRTTARRPAPKRAADDADLDKALPHLHDDPDRQRVLEAIIRLQRLTGMRPGEVLELRGRDIDRSTVPWLYCPASGGKTLHLDKPRRIWLGPQARALLEPFLAGGPELVFRLPSRLGGHVAVRIEFLRFRLAEACRIAGVPVVTPHQIRHTFATDLHRRYEDDELVAAALGDTPEVTRRVYVDDPADAAAKRIAEAVG